MKRFLIVWAAIAVMTQPAVAGYVSGNDLHQWCQGGTSGTTFVTAYSVAVYDTIEVASSIENSGIDAFCAPVEVTRGQIGDVVCRYLGDNPQNRHWIGSVLVWNAVVKAWPCQ